MKERTTKFWLHYNKPASKAAGRPQFTVHYKGVCHIVDKVITHVPMETQIRTTQPHAVLAGYCTASQFLREDSQVIIMAN